MSGVTRERGKGASEVNRLAGKVAIVTGAASGLGRADALALVEQGARVLLADIIEAAGTELAAQLNELGAGSARFMLHDVREEARWAQVVSAAREHFGALHVLVNNAGVVVVANPETTTLEQFRFANAVMSEGVFLVNMSSVASHLGYPVFFAYSAAKGAVRAMTKSIAVHCQANKYHIRCNSIHAGAIDTPMIAQANAVLGMKNADYEAAPWGLGTPRDVANLVVYLASDESRFVNGTEILVDNAMSIQ